MYSLRMFFVVGAALEYNSSRVYFSVMVLQKIRVVKKHLVVHIMELVFVSLIERVEKFKSVLV
jgi:hypothetical protein